MKRKFYDLHIKKINNETSRLLKKFGYDGACLVKDINLKKEKNLNLEEFKKPKYDNLEIHIGVNLISKKWGPIKKFIRRYRRDLGLIYAPIKFWKKGSRELIDIFTMNGKMEDRIARKLKEKGIAVEIPIKEILKTYGLKRASIINKVWKTIKILNKYETKIVCTSKAENPYDLRAPKDIVSFLDILEAKNTIDSVSKNCEFLLKRSKEIRNSKTIMPGVKKRE